MGRATHLWYMNGVFLIFFDNVRHLLFDNVRLWYRDFYFVWDFLFNRNGHMFRDRVRSMESKKWENVFIRNVSRAGNG